MGKSIFGKISEGEDVCYRFNQSITNNSFSKNLCIMIFNFYVNAKVSKVEMTNSRVTLKHECRARH